MLLLFASLNNKYLHSQYSTRCNFNINPRHCPPLPLPLPPHRCLIKDFELRPNVLDLLQHVFIKKTVGKEKVLQKQLIELIDLNQQIGVIEKTRYSTTKIQFLGVFVRF